MHSETDFIWMQGNPKMSTKLSISVRPTKFSRLESFSRKKYLCFHVSLSVNKKLSRIFLNPSSMSDPMDSAFALSQAFFYLLMSIDCNGFLFTITSSPRMKNQEKYVTIFTIISSEVLHCM